MNMGDASSAIITFLSKFIEKDNWKFLAAITFACVAGIYCYFLPEYKKVWWLISIGVFCASILVLNFLTYLTTKTYTSISEYVRKRNERKKYQKKQLAEKQLAKINQEKQNAKLASDIWALVEYLPKEYIEEALTFFDLPLSDGNALIRYMAPAKDLWCKEYEIYEKISRAERHFSFYNNRMRLLEIDMSSGHYFVKINNYLYNLLSNYSKTGKWEKLKYSEEVIS